jgi:hypothetical protein
VGDMLALKEQILEGIKPEGVDLTEKIELKKQIYEKFVGVDLWYAYVDPSGNVKVDLLFKPTNSTGNLLNGPSGDSATIEPDDFKSPEDGIVTSGGDSGGGTGGTQTPSGTGGGSGDGEIPSGTSIGDIITSQGTGGTNTPSGKPTGSGVTPNGRVVGTIYTSTPSVTPSSQNTYPSSSNSSTSFGNILTDKDPSDKNKGGSGGYKGKTDSNAAGYFTPGGGYSGRVKYQGLTDDGTDGETKYLELLSRIGLFFKPDKTSILTVNSKECTWSLDTDVLIPDTIYVFPDPNKYGDIGNNKNPLYPLIMEHRLNYEIKNISSGFAKDDPILHISNQGWYSYYSKQQDDFKIYDNRNYDYSLTSLVNKGIMTNYQTDVWGNEFGILKGYEIREENGKHIISTYPQYNELGMKNDTNEIDVTVEGKHILLNGGYFRDPFNMSSDGGFNFDRKMIVIDKENDKYILSGISIDNNHFYHEPSTPMVSYGDSFSVISSEEKIIDHYKVNVEKYEDAKADDIIVDNSELTTNLYSSYQTEKKTGDIKSEGGELWVKLLGKEPKKFEEVFTYDKFNANRSWFDDKEDDEDEEKVINFSVVTQNLIIETNKNYHFVYYNYTGDDVDDIRETTEVYKISKEEMPSGAAVLYNDLLYNESDKCFYILLIE